MPTLNNYTVSDAVFSVVEGNTIYGTQQTATLTIIPNTGFTVDYQDFSIVAGTLPSEVDSVVFQQDGNNVLCIATFNSTVVMPSENLINVFADKIELMTGQGGITAKNIEVMAKRLLPESMLQEDPESFEIFCNTAYTICRRTLDEHELEYLLNGALLNINDDELKNNKDFKNDLRDNIYLIFQKRFAVPSMEYAKKLKGEADKFQEMGVAQTGMPIIFKKLDEQLVKSQIQSLVVAIILILIMLTVLLKSLAGGLISIVPIVMTITANFGIMAYVGVPLDDATMMIGSIAMGIGIDYTIHFISRLRMEIKRGNEIYDALRTTIGTAGRAILINAFSVASGFLVLLMSNTLPLQRFGWLTATTMFISAFSAITVLPALIILIKPSFVIKMNNIENNGSKS